MHTSDKELSHLSNTTISDHFKDIDGKVGSGFSSGTKGYVNYLSSVGTQFANKLESNSKSSVANMKVVANVSDFDNFYHV